MLEGRNGQARTNRARKVQQAARDLGCDDDEARFRERAGKLVTLKPGEKPE